MYWWNDKAQDVYLCPNGKQLELNSLHRSASGLYRAYLAEKQDCQNCSLRIKCLGENDKRGARKLEYSYFTPVRQQHLARQHDADYQQALKKQLIWCEGAFAAQKWGHNLTRALHRGLKEAENHCLLSATALNHKENDKIHHLTPQSVFFVGCFSLCVRLKALCQQTHGETQI